MSSTPSSDLGAASEAMELEAVISREREENIETRIDSNQAARDETEDDESMKKAKSVMNCVGHGCVFIWIM